MTKNEFIKQMTELMLNNYGKIKAETAEEKERNSTLHAIYVSMMEDIDKEELKTVNLLLLTRFKEFGKNLLKNSTDKYKEQFESYKADSASIDALNL